MKNKKKKDNALLLTQAILVVITAALLLLTATYIFYPSATETQVKTSVYELPIDGYLPPLDSRVPYTIEYYDTTCGACNSIKYETLDPGDVPFGAGLGCTDKDQLNEEALFITEPIAESLIVPAGTNFIETCSIVLFKSGPGGESGNAMVVFTDNLDEWKNNVIWSSVIPHTDLEDHVGPFLYPTWIKFTFRADRHVVAGKTYYIVISDSHDELVYTYTYPIPGEENPSECPDYEDGMLYIYALDYHDIWGNYSWNPCPLNDLNFWMVSSLKKPDLEVEVGKEVITASGTLVAAVSALSIGYYRRYRL